MTKASFALLGVGHDHAGGSGLIRFVARTRHRLSVLSTRTTLRTLITRHPVKDVTGIARPALMRC